MNPQQFYVSPVISKSPAFPKYVSKVKCKMKYLSLTVTVDLRSCIADKPLCLYWSEGLEFTSDIGCCLNMDSCATRCLGTKHCTCREICAIVGLDDCFVMENINKPRLDRNRMIHDTMGGDSFSDCVLINPLRTHVAFKQHLSS